MYSIAIQSDGKVLIGGGFTSYSVPGIIPSPFGGEGNGGVARPVPGPRGATVSDVLPKGSKAPPYSSGGRGAGQ